MHPWSCFDQDKIISKYRPFTGTMYEWSANKCQENWGLIFFTVKIQIRVISLRKHASITDQYLFRLCFTRYSLTQSFLIAKDVKVVKVKIHWKQRQMINEIKMISKTETEIFQMKNASTFQLPNCNVCAKCLLTSYQKREKSKYILLYHELAFYFCFT